MLNPSTTKISNEQVNRVVSAILNKRQRTLREQQKTFIRRDTDENKKRNNYLVDKFTSKQRNNSSKENEEKSTTSTSIPSKAKPSMAIFNNDDDDDDDFISFKKSSAPKIIKTKPKSNEIISQSIQNDPIKQCLEYIISKIEDEDARCPVCNDILSSLITLEQRDQHVNRCLEESQMRNIESKQQQTLLSYSNFSSKIAANSRKPNIVSSTSSFQLKCQICGTTFQIKRTYLSHLKKCSSQNSVQLKHVVNFASKIVEIPEKTTDEPKVVTTKKIKNRVIKMEMPQTEDDEQQQLAIALSASLKPIEEPVNAFEILQTAAKKSKIIDLQKTPLWNISNEERVRLSSMRLSNLCERLITARVSSTESYQFPPSPLFDQSRADFGHVDWWKITTTDPQDDEIPMTQLARIMDQDQ